MSHFDLKLDHGQHFNQKFYFLLFSDRKNLTEQSHLRALKPHIYSKLFTGKGSRPL